MASPRLPSYRHYVALTLPQISVNKFTIMPGNAGTTKGRYDMKFTKLLMAGVTSCVLSAGMASAELKSITIATNPSGSVYFLIASNFAKLFQTKLDIRSTAQPFTGSSVYLPSVNQGEVTLGLSSTVDSGLAYSGTGDFPMELTELRSLGGIWSIPYALVARGDSDINSADDLAG